MTTLGKILYKLWQQDAEDIDKKIAEAEQAIKDLMIEERIDMVNKMSRFVENELSGCGGFESEPYSSVCKWCGETQLAPFHNRARILAELRSLIKGGEK